MELVIEELNNKVKTSNKLKLKYSNIILSKSLRFIGIMDGILEYLKDYEERENKEFYFVIVKYNCLDNFLTCDLKVIQRANYKHSCYFSFNWNSKLHNAIVCSSIIGKRDELKKEIKNIYNYCNIAIGEVYKKFYMNYLKFLNNNNCEINFLNNERNSFNVKKFYKNYISTTTNNRLRNHNITINIDMNEKINFMNKSNIYNFINNYNDENINIIDNIYKEKVINLNSSFCYVKSIYENEEKEGECVICYENTKILTKCCNNNTCELCYSKIKNCAMCRRTFLEKYICD